MTTAATNELIDRLVADLAPVPRSAVLRRLALGAGAGALATLAAMLLWLGPRADLGEAPMLPSFWIKAVYTFAAAAAGLLAVERLARPGGGGRHGALLGVAAFIVVVVMAAGELAAGPGDGHRILFGRTASFCPLAIVILAVPVLAGTCWAMRGLAPTRTVVAGLGAGLFAGAVSAFLYSFSCAERGIPFLASWYTLGIVLAGVLGALGGRAGLLRW